MADFNEHSGRAPTEPSLENDVREVARFELLAERPMLEKRRELAGRVAVHKEVERRTETVSVELITERLVIEVQAGDAGVWLDGEQLAAGDTREIVVYREEAELNKRAVVSEEVRLLRRAVVEQKALDIELGREVLRFEQVTPSDKVERLSVERIDPGWASGAATEAAASEVATTEAEGGETRA